MLSFVLDMYSFIEKDKNPMCQTYIRTVRVIDKKFHGLIANFFFITVSADSHSERKL